MQKYRQDEKTKVICAYKAGNSDRKISQMYGIPKSTVRLWYKNYEVFGEEIYKEKKNYKKWSNEIKVTAVSNTHTTSYFVAVQVPFKALTAF